LRLLHAQMRSQAQYRASFVTDLVGSFLFGVVDFAAVIVLFRVTRTLGGFEFRAVLLMSALAGLSFAIADLCVGNIDTMQNYIRTGRLDAILVRPLGALGQLLMMDFSARRTGRVLITAGVLTVAVRRAGIDWTPARVALLVLAPLAGAVVFASVFIGTAVVAFWWIESGKFGDGFTYGGRDFTMYPMTVYSGWFQKVFAYGLGFAFVAYYPSLALLHRADPLGLPAAASWLAPLACVPAAGLAGLAWRQGIRQYRSTGS
jgi:ABC-2 type transport system permease protein